MISVIVPAYNAGKTLGACLNGLGAQTAPAGSFEIVVVDDGSDDDTRQVAEAHATRVVSQSNGGAASARNLGARTTEGEILMFVDADSVPDARWIEAMAAPFVDPSIAGVSGVKKTRQREFWARYIQLEYDFKYDRMQANGDTDFVDSSSAAYRREVFTASGGFDTTLMEAEDTDLSFRLAEQSKRLVLVRDAIVYHTHPTTLREFLRRKYQYAIWRAVTYARHPRKAVSDTRTPQSQKLQAALAYVLLPVAAGACLWNLLFWAACALIVVFVLTTLRFAARCWQVSPAYALAAPLVLLCAAYAGGAGAAVGFLKGLGPDAEPPSLPVN